MRQAQSVIVAVPALPAVRRLSAREIREQSAIGVSNLKNRL
jgi:hypothetical protein